MSVLFPGDRVGMIAPPPVIFAVPLAAGWLLDRIAPWPITVEAHDARVTMATVLLIVGLAVAFSAVATFLAAGTPILPLEPATTIVKRGPYRFTRNPMYVGLTLVTLSLALYMNTAWALLLVPVAVAVIDRGVIVPEERYLQHHFAEQYAAYKRQVRRWL